MNIVIDLIRREVCNYWRFPGDGRQDTDSALSYSYLSSERKKYTGLIFFFFTHHLILLMPDFIEAYYPFGPGHISF